MSPAGCGWLAWLCGCDDAWWMAAYGSLPYMRPAHCDVVWVVLLQGHKGNVQVGDGEEGVAERQEEEEGEDEDVGEEDVNGEKTLSLGPVIKTNK